MKVAVTGATGFIGRHVVPALLEQGVHVIAAARDPGKCYSPVGRLETAAIDIADPDTAFAKLGNPDVLLHLAWGGLPNYRSDAHILHELPKQIAFLDACARGGLKRLVVAGTCLEYGMQSGCLHEDAPAAPTTHYGQAKDRLRIHLQTLAETGGPELTWIRLFYLFGQYQAPTSLYSQLRTAVASGAAEFPMSPGDQLRDFMAVEAAATLLSKLTLEAPAAGVVNLASGVPKSIEELAREWLRQWNANLSLVLGVHAYPDYEPHAFWASTQKLNRLVGLQ